MEMDYIGLSGVFPGVATFVRRYRVYQEWASRRLGP